MIIPSRSSDAGPASLSRCHACDASMSNNEPGCCIACDSPCCHACGQHCNDGWWCQHCMETLIVRIAGYLNSDMRDVELGAKL